MISSTKNEEMSSGNYEKEMQRQSRRQQEANQIFSMVAKFSQEMMKMRCRGKVGGKPDFRYALRKFRKDC